MSKIDDWLNDTSYDSRYLSFANQERFDCREYDLTDQIFKEV